MTNALNKRELVDVDVAGSSFKALKLREGIQKPPYPVNRDTFVYKTNHMVQGISQPGL